MGKERGTLKVSAKSWHGRVYLNWKSRAEYKNGPRYRENLCHYVRVVLFWAPINWFLKRDFYIKKLDAHIPPVGFVFIFAIVGALLAMFIAEPLKFSLGVGAVVVVVALAIGAFIGIDILKERARDKRWEEMERRMDPNYVPEPKDEGFFKVMWRFLSAKKGKVCPFIEVEERVA